MIQCDFGLCFEVPFRQDSGSYIQPTDKPLGEQERSWVSHTSLLSPSRIQFITLGKELVFSVLCATMRHIK